MIVYLIFFLPKTKCRYNGSFVKAYLLLGTACQASNAAQNPVFKYDIFIISGVYTLSCAKAGRRVLAVEALDRNMQHICASVMEGVF